MKTKVSLTRCTSYDTAEVIKTVALAVERLGGMRQFVKPGEKILLKPNLLSARTPDRGVTTHPEIVRAVARLVRESGAVPLLGDSPGGAVRGVERVWKETGMLKVAEEEQIELVNFETSGAEERKIDHPSIPSVHLARAVLCADGVINLPKLKTHSFLIFTGAVKNLYGCVPGLRKAEYHKLAPAPKDFGHMLAEIYLLVKPKLRLTIVDGVMGMEGNGPSTGDLRKLDMLIASADGVALDTVTTRLLGFDPKKVEPLPRLARKKAGEADFSNIEITGESPASFSLDNFKFPSNWHLNLIPPFLVKLLGKLIWMKPVVVPEMCKNCMLCVNSCPVKAIKQQGKEKPFVVHKECINCLCCHEMCQDQAIKLKSSFLARRFIRQ